MANEDVLHVAAFRIRVNGSGVLRGTFKGLDSVASETSPTLTMSATPGVQPTVLSNFIGQRIFLRLETTAIDEKFNINRVIIFVKPIWSSYPQ